MDNYDDILAALVDMPMTEANVIAAFKSIRELDEANAKAAIPGFMRAVGALPSGNSQYVEFVDPVETEHSYSWE